jgi:DNA-binding NtrC family response regulator
MAVPSQNRTNASVSSNEGGAWGHLGRAITGTLSRFGDPEQATEILHRAALATESERAFLVEGSPDGGQAPRVLACSSLRLDGRDEPSRGAAREALRVRTPRIWQAVASGGRFPRGDSVRSLGLRTVLCAPVRSSGPSRAALLVDTRRAAIVGNDERVQLLEAFASLLGLWMGAKNEADRSGPSEGASGEVETAPPDLIGRSPAFVRVVERARRSARCKLPVLIQGESGTGKEGLARLIHHCSGRRDGPFLGLNCVAVPEALLENELFGSTRGAFTGSVNDHPGLFRLARGGTLLLDEVGDMPPTMQGKLLRVLQESRVRPLGARDEADVDVRIIAATHRNLTDLVEVGSFRADLYYRLAVVRLDLPPLRARREDLPLLVEHLTERLVRDAAVEPFTVLPCALERLGRHTWRGNVRELEAVLARSRLNAPGPELAADHLDFDGPGVGKRSDASAPSTLETEMIVRALDDSHGHVPLAAAHIGWTRQKLHRRMRELRIVYPRS